MAQIKSSNAKKLFFNKISYQMKYLILLLMTIVMSCQTKSPNTNTHYIIERGDTLKQPKPFKLLKKFHTDDFHPYKIRKTYQNAFPYLSSNMIDLLLDFKELGFTYYYPDPRLDSFELRVDFERNTIHYPYSIKEDIIKILFINELNHLRNKFVLESQNAKTNVWKLLKKLHIMYYVIEDGQNGKFQKFGDDIYLGDFFTYEDGHNELLAILWSMKKRNQL